MIVRIPIKSRQHWESLRPTRVGCSEVSALTGAHDYLTAYGLAGRKLGRIADTPDNASMRRGKLLEPIAVRLIGEHFPTWRLEPNTDDNGLPKVCYADEDIRLIGSPDLLVEDPDRGRGVVQIKNHEPGEFNKRWRDVADGPAELSPPIGVGIQTIAEAHVTGAQFAAAAALVIGHGVEVHIVEIPIHAGVIARIKAELAAFWRLVDDGRMPDPDYGRDAEAIREIHRHSDGSELDLTADNEIPTIVHERELAAEWRRNADRLVRELDARIMHRLGGAERARFAGGVISAKTIHRDAYEVPATSYRQLRIKHDNPERPL